MMTTNLPPMRTTNRDFSSLGWHDNYIHAIHFECDVESNQHDLVFDIDFTTKWEPGDSGQFTFFVAPATLRFHDVRDLKISLQWSDSELVLCIDEILMESSDSESFQKYKIAIDWPSPGGEIVFVSAGFTQELRANPKPSKRMKLPQSERVPITGSRSNEKTAT
jgi:hypothetical protein